VDDQLLPFRDRVRVDAAVSHVTHVELLEKVDTVGCREAPVSRFQNRYNVDAICDILKISRYQQDNETVFIENKHTGWPPQIGTIFVRINTV